MTQEATQIEVPNFEATTDGKTILTSKHNDSNDSGNIQNGNVTWT